MDPVLSHTDDPAPFEAELKQREKALGANHPDVAESCSNLAILYNQKGDTGEHCERCNDSCFVVSLM